MTDDDLQQQPTARAKLSFTACLLWLTLALLLVLPVVGGVAFNRYGQMGAWAALVAFGVCWLAGVLALGITQLTSVVGRAINGLLLAMLVRMGLPLVVGTVLQRRGGPLADAGVFGQIVIFFLVMLAVEAYLSVRLVKQTTTTS